MVTVFVVQPTHPEHPVSLRDKGSRGVTEETFCCCHFGVGSVSFMHAEHSAWGLPSSSFFF